VEPDESSEEEWPGEEGQEDFIIVMRKATWLETVIIQGSHGALTIEPMGTQLKTS
jgi:hypothetical protein